MIETFTFLWYGYAEALALTGALTFITFHYAKYKRRHYAKRKLDMEFARSAMKEHYSALEQILASEYPSETFKNWLVSFSDLLTDPDFQLYIYELDTELSKKDGLDGIYQLELGDDYQQILSEKTALESEHPELSEAFHKALGTAVAIAHFRRPASSEFTINAYIAKAPIGVPEIRFAAGLKEFAAQKLAPQGIEPFAPVGVK